MDLEPDKLPSVVSTLITLQNYEPDTSRFHFYPSSLPWL